MGLSASISGVKVLEGCADRARQIAARWSKYGNGAMAEAAEAFAVGVDRIVEDGKQKQAPLASDGPPTRHSHGSGDMLDMKAWVETDAAQEPSTNHDEAMGEVDAAMARLKELRGNFGIRN